MEIIRGRLSAADFSNPSQRYNEDTDTFQYTPDNGAHWYDSPEADPRHSNIFRLPPLTTTDPRCDAAANMVKWIKDFIDSVIAQLEADATALALTNNFLTTLTTLFPPALLLLLLQEAATSLFDTGATALDAAFTSTQYDLLLCAFYCNIEADGTVTAADLTDVGGQIVATMDTTAALVVAEILFIQGEVGLSNAGVVGGETGDCSGCVCGWCFEIDFTSTDGGWSEFTDGVPGANYTPGTGWTQKTSASTTGTYIQSPVFAETEFTSIEMTYDAEIVATSDVRYGQLGAAFPMVDVCSAAGGFHTVLWEGSVNFDRVGLQVGNSTTGGGGTSILSHAKFTGIGDNPFGSDNC